MSRMKILKMKKQIITILSIVVLLSCNKQKSDINSVFYFGLYNSKDIEIQDNLFIVEKKKVDLFDSIYVFRNENKVLSFKEGYNERNGLFRFIKNKKTLTHSSNDTLPQITDYNTSYAPFINRETTLIDTRVYKIEGKDYKIFHYSEFQSSHKGFDSYYLENIGFICYYDFSRDNYILCDSTNINRLKINEITKRLINDKDFFARYIGAKLFPNYYRPSDEGSILN